MKQPTFSICIPNYNYEGYLGATIESVLAQTYPHFEIIVVDNASTDKSFEVASSYQDARIRVYRNTYNVGFAPNLQIATGYATKDFINLLSSDDIMKPEALETYARLIVEHAESYDDLILASDNEVINNDDVLTGYKYFDTTALKGNWSDAKQYETYLKNASNNTQFMGIELLRSLAPDLNTLAGFLTIVYSRKLWERVSGYNAVRSIGPDKYFNYKLLLQNPKTIYVNQALFKYRFHESANIRSYFSTLKQQVDDYLNILDLGDTFEKKIGLNRDTLINNYLNRFCFGFSLSSIKNGRYTHAWRTFFFSLASFPGHAVKQKLFYINLLMLLFLPFTIVLLRMLRLFKKM
ncbi:MAG: glycosyltransferase family 2 protein [Cyclobacteriaceae bacterium]|nr:glycosyltransferase family 2 protein [Cyclobacteriaceae bacterium]